jgi:G3E family GTPase
MSETPFTVIGGFLGAGKTTLLNRVLAQSSGLRYAVLVNDFGSLEIDAALVTSQNSETVSLTNGCMCCSIADGFARVLGKILGRLDDFDHVVVEASGVAQPARIMDLARLEPELRPNGVVVMVDAALVRQHANDAYVKEVIVDQLRSADLLVVNKIGLLCTDLLRELRSWLDTITNGTPVVECDYASVSLELVVGASGFTVASARGNFDTPVEPLPYSVAAESIFRSISFTSSVCVDRGKFLEATGSLPNAVIRGKGLVRFDGRPDELWLWQKIGATSTLTPVAAGDVIGCRVVLIGTPEFLPPSARMLAELFGN